MSAALTKSRLLNALKCYWNYALSLFGLVRISHMPTFVSVEPASICQLKCPECPVGMAKKPMANSQRLMAKEVWQRVLTEVKDTAHTIQFYFQGEPLLNKELPQMIREAHETGLYTIVSTNAQALTQPLAEELVQAGLNRIIISMDGLTDETYNAYRVGGRLDRCKAALRYLREAKDRTPYTLHSTPIIELQCLRLRTNEQEWREFKKQYKALGADRLVFKTAQLYDYAKGHPLMPSDARYSRYEKGADGLFHRKKMHRGCLRVWSGVVVTTNGDVLPCCYDKSRMHAYGNIMCSSMKELFADERAIAFRRAALHEQPQICQECWK